MRALAAAVTTVTGWSGWRPASTVTAVRAARSSAGWVRTTVAAALLADWPAARTRFRKVLPRTYKAVLAARDAAERAGLSEPEVHEKMMEAATHG